MKLSKIAIIVLVLTGSVGCDQMTKVVAREHLAGQGRLSYLGDTVRIGLVENHGAFLGLGSSLPDPVRTLVFTVMVGVVIVGALVWLVRTSGLSMLAVFGVSLFVGGGIGNLIDRIVFDGGVTDFLNVGIGWLRTGVFNVADIWIMAGVALVALAPDWRRIADEDA